MGKTNADNDQGAEAGLLAFLDAAEASGKIDPETAGKLRAILALVFDGIGRQILGAFAVPPEPLLESRPPIMTLAAAADLLFTRLRAGADRVRELEQHLWVYGSMHRDQVSREAASRALNQRN